MISTEFFIQDFSGRATFLMQQPKQSKSKSQNAFPTNDEIRVGTRLMDHPPVSRLVLCK